ncbi:hypothetical protein CMALT430_160126 [Carnobacterium maltaromaticum]|nr:hypothetical protein CMALT430_160126 [Carnobacterium maltaromaticum]
MKSKKLQLIMIRVFNQLKTLLVDAEQNLMTKSGDRTFQFELI